MSYHRFINFIIVCLVCSVSFVKVRAQEPGAPPKAISQQAESVSPRPEHAQQPEYVLEVHTPEGCLFAPITGEKRIGTLVYALARPNKYLPDSAGRPIVSKVTFFAKGPNPPATAGGTDKTGDLWNLKVIVGLGEFYDAGEQQVAALTLGTNERAEAGDVTRFGLSPFRVGVVKVIGQLGGKPHIRNITQSISLEKLEADPLPEPFRLYLKNNSVQDVVAIQYNTFKGQQLLFLKWLSHGLTQPLIKAGETYQLEVLSEDKSCGDADGYRPYQSNRIDIVSAVFADGSYEGEPGLPALIRGVAYGNKKLLERVVATLDNLSGDEVPNAPEMIYYLRTLYEGTDETVEPYLVDTLQNSLPSLGPNATFTLSSFIRSGIHDIRNNLLNDAQRLEALNKTQNTEAIKKWCVRTKTKYKQWLAAAQAVTGH